MENAAAQQIAPEISMRWYHDNRIVAFTIRTVARSSWEAWQKSMMDLKRDWPADRPFLNLQDNVYDKVASTPSIREFAVQVGRFRPEIVQYNAIILPKNFVAQFVEMSTRIHKDPNVTNRVFATVEEGLAWLETKL
jgi:hypothetical protein